MPEYRFKFIDKHSNKVTRGITAENDKMALKRRDEILEREGGSYVNGSMETSNVGRNFRKILAPGEYDLEAARKAGVKMPGLSILEG